MISFIRTTLVTESFHSNRALTKTQVWYKPNWTLPWRLFFWLRERSSNLAFVQVTLKLPVCLVATISNSSQPSGNLTQHGPAILPVLKCVTPGSVLFPRAAPLPRRPPARLSLLTFSACFVFSLTRLSILTGLGGLWLWFLGGPLIPWHRDRVVESECHFIPDWAHYFRVAHASLAPTVSSRHRPHLPMPSHFAAPVILSMNVTQAGHHPLTKTNLDSGTRLVLCVLSVHPQTCF